MSASSVIMEDQFNFDLNFDFLDAPTSIAKPNATVSVTQVLDVQTLASKIASVNDLVLQIKTEKEEHAKLQKQMQDLSESATSIRKLYEQEKAEKSKYAVLSQEFKEKYEAAESRLANQTLHFEQLSSKIKQSEEKGPIPYNELMLRYHRLALYLDEDNDLPQKEKQKLQQIQEYMVAKKLSTLTAFKKKKKPLPIPVQKDQGTQHYPQMISKSTFTDFEVMQKEFVSQGTQHTSYTTTRGTNTENQNAKKDVKTQGTQYISSTTTRSTSTSGFIKTRSVGTNFPDESTKLVDDIFSEMLFDIVPLSPLAEEDVAPVEQVEMKTVGTITGLKNVRKAIDYVTPVSIKSSDSRPPSRNMFERVKNEAPFLSTPNMNSFVELGANSSAVPNNITDLWNLLGHTFFSLLQNVNTFNSSMNLNVLNDRIRSTNINVTNDADQPRSSDSGSNFGKTYFEELCRNSNSPRDFGSTRRSTATSPIAELENPSLQNEPFANEGCAAVQQSTFCSKVSDIHNARNIEHINPSPHVEIQKIVLNKVFHSENAAADPSLVAGQSNVGLAAMPIKRRLIPKAKKCKSCRKFRKQAINEQGTSAFAFTQNSKSSCTHTCAALAQVSNACGTANHSEEFIAMLPTAQPVRETPFSVNLEDELFGSSDEEHPLSAHADSNCHLPVGNQPVTGFQEHNVFCKPSMPKKRKQVSVDTQIFHMKDVQGKSSEMPSNSKRKRSMKSTNNCSKIRICSESSFDSSTLATGISCLQEGETNVKLVKSCSSNKNALDATVSAASSRILPSERSGFSVSSSHQPQPLVLESKTTEYTFDECSLNSPGTKEPAGIDQNLPAPRDSTGLDSSNMLISLGINTQTDMYSRNKKNISEDDKVSTKRIQVKGEEVPVIDVSSDKALALKCDQLADNFVNPAEVGQSGGLDTFETNFPPQTLIRNSSEIENAFNIRFNSSTPAIKRHPTSVAEVNQRYTEKNEHREVNPLPVERTCTESIWAIPASISNPTESSNSYLDNISLDDSNERLEEILHRISDEFSTPERPVSAIPPCDSSQTEDSFSEEEHNVIKPAVPVKEKIKRGRGCLITAVKRSERLKAKNSIQEAIKYTELKIPAIEFGKYTKRKTDQKSVCAKIPEENSQPSTLPNEISKPPSECSLSCELVRVQEVNPERIQNSTSESEENTSNELVIDLQDESIATPTHVEVISPPGESKSGNASTDVSQTEPSSLSSFDEFSDVAQFDESPSSPLPIDREPETNHVPKQIPERTNKKPKSDSLLSQIIANYNPECYKKVQESRQEQDKVTIKEVQTTLESYVNATGESEDAVLVVEKMCSITNCAQLIAHVLISEVKKAPRPEKESTSPIPELYLGVTLRKILQLLDPLYAHLPSLRTDLLKTIEKSIFSFTKDFTSLDMTLNLTQFYLALVADVNAPSNPARLFICKCLFFYTKKAIPMIYEALCVYPSVLPHRDDTTYDRSDALISTIQCLLMSTFYDTEKCDLKAKQMLHKLRNFYNYESLKPSREEVIENLIAKLRAGRFKNVSYSFAVICKRTDRKYILKNILEERMLPLANEYYQTISETAENDERIACVLECISYVIKPFPVDTDITTYINLYSRFLNAVDRQVVQEAAVSAILRTIRFGYVQCFRAIYKFQPKYEISEEFKVMLRSFVYKKNLGYLRKLESQINVLTQ